MIPSALILVVSLLGQAPAPAAGTRIDIGDEATLFVPEGYRPAGGVVDVLVHLHGSSGVVEPALIAARWPGVLVEFNRKGLSSVYAKPFSDPALFPRLLDAVPKALRERHLVEEPKPGRLALSSFSAGFGGVREILKERANVNRIDILVMADSIYAGYEGDPAARRVDPKLMAGFRDFAALAAAGSKTFVLTHSAQVPEGYASTTETADDLIRSVGGEATPKRVDLGDGWVESREARKGGFRVVGFEGASAEDHMRHLRRISATWSWAASPR